VAVDSAGNLYVADGYGNGRVVKLAANSGIQTVPLIGLGNPAGVAVDSAGSVYVTDYSHQVLLKLPAK
jgi:serine/threonine-protein kinase